MKYNFSVIIPNKNNIILLERLLKSIPVRDDLEIIIVDDNSDHGVLNQTNYPGIKRPNTSVIFTTEGRGAGYARNQGIKYAKGKWLLFADSDDFYNVGAFDELSKYIESDIDVLYYNVNSVDSESLLPGNRDKHFDEYINLYLSGKDKYGENMRFRRWEPWNKMIRRKFIDQYNLRFDEIPRCNDMVFSLLTSLYANKFEIIDTQIYCVTSNPASITRTKIKKNVFWHCFICEMKKNAIYDLVHHKAWKSIYLFLTLCLLKNNGILQTFDYYTMLYKRREELKEIISLFKSNIMIRL